MIMTTGAVNGEAHGATSDDINPVIDDLFTAGYTRAERKESQRGKIRIRIALLQLVRSNLVDEELVVGHIVIE